MPNTSLLSAPAAVPSAEHVSPLTCSWEHRGKCAAWVHLAGELDLATAPQLSLVLADAQRHAGLIVIDLRELRFMDSIGGRALTDACSLARRKAKETVVVRGSAQVDGMFTLMAIDMHAHVIELDCAT